MIFKKRISSFAHLTLYRLFQGKRRRNRSNVEAMAAKHNNPNEHNEPELTNGRRMMGMMVKMVVMLRMMETPMRMTMIGWMLS